MTGALGGNDTNSNKRHSPFQTGKEKLKTTGWYKVSVREDKQRVRISLSQELLLPSKL